MATPPLRSAVDGLLSRLGPCRAVVGPAWHDFAERLTNEWVDHTTATAVVVGPLAAVLGHASTATDEFGFVMPMAQVTKWWQPESSWRDDATLELWRARWSTVAIDRIQVPTDRVIIEFAVGNARPTPAVLTSS